jgi:hypothetical protein
VPRKVVSAWDDSSVLKQLLESKLLFIETKVALALFWPYPSPILTLP